MSILWLVLASALGAAPEIPACFAISPTFATADDTHSVGTMFATKIGDRVVLLTAHHLFGPPGGFDKALGGAEVASTVQSVTLRDAYTYVSCGSAEPRAVADAQPMGDQGAHRDVAVFVPKRASGLKSLELNAGQRSPAARPLAEKAAAVGDVVYLVARVGEGTPRTFTGEVVQATAKALYFKYQDATLELAAANGAAVLNAAGEVVGLHLSSGKMGDGTLVGVANPAASLRARAQKALAAVD